MRKRPRLFDSLASTGAVRSILRQVKQTEPLAFPDTESEQISQLNALRYVTSKSSKHSLKGRTSPWKEEQLHSVSSCLKQVLAKETKGRISINTFIGQYLPLLTYPADVLQALQQGQINRQEALNLVRLSAVKLQVSADQALEVRKEVLQNHLRSQESQNQLRQRVNELLGYGNLMSRETLALGILKTDSLLDFDIKDVKHVFFETIKDMFFAIRSLEPEDLRDEDIDKFMQAADSLSNIIRSIHQRKKQIPVTHTIEKLSSARQSPASEIKIDITNGQLTYKFQ